MSGVWERISRLPPKRRALLELKLGKLPSGGAVGSAPTRLDKDVFPLSFAQERLWFVDQLGVESSAYNICYGIRLRGCLSVPVLRLAMDAVVARQEALRTRFVETEQGPEQRIEPPRPLPLPHVDLRALPAGRREPEARRLVSQDSQRQLRLDSWPLLRSHLLQVDEQEHVLSLVVHHIISDGWSLVVLIRDLTLLYLALVAGCPSRLPALSIRYGDFADWQRRWLGGAVGERQLAYWRRALDGAPPFVDVPTDYPRPEPQSFRGERERLSLSAEVVGRLEALCHREPGTTLFMVLLTAFQSLVGHLSGQEDFVVSCPISYRNHAETEGVIGFFANTLLFRADLTGDPEFEEVVSRVRSQVVGGYTHQDLPLQRVVQEIDPGRAMSYTPFLQLSLNFVDRELGGVSALGDLGRAAAGEGLADLQVEEFDFDYANAAGELGLVLAYDGRQVRGSLHYKADLFERSTIRLVIALFGQLVDLAGRCPETRLSALGENLRAYRAQWLLREKERLHRTAQTSLRRRRRIPTAVDRGESTGG